MANYKSNSNVVYSCKYHVVWCPKYRRKVLVDGVDTRLKAIIQECAEELKCEIIEMEIINNRSEAKLVECDLIYEHRPSCNQLMNGYSNEARNLRCSEVMRGKTVTSETRTKISSSRTGVIANGWQGRTHTENSKKRIRESRVCCKIQCNETGIVYASIKEAARELEIAVSLIRGVIYGRCNQTHGMTFSKAI